MGHLLEGLVNECPPGHSLSLPNLVIIILKNQLLQFSMHSIHNFSYKTYHLKCLKSALGALVNIFLYLINPSF